MRTFRAALQIAVIVLSIPLADACGTRAQSTEPTTVLLFNGEGTSQNDAAAVESILRDLKVAYTTVDARQLGTMSEPQLSAYHLLIVPGGNFEQMGNSLSPATTATVRNAINGGMHYLGICAGAFIAGNSPYNGLNLTSGVRFNFYSAERQGIRKAAVLIARAGTSSQLQYWEDGPELTGWGEVIATYPDGTPAVVQGAFGKGHVILSGTHPEAPERWRRGMSFNAPADESRKYAATLIDAALHGRALEHY